MSDVADDHKANYEFEENGCVMWKCLLCGLVMDHDPGATPTHTPAPRMREAESDERRKA